MRFSKMRKHLKKITLNIESPQRMVLYLLLILFVSVIMVWWLLTRSSLSQNFFAASIELFITVFVVERLIFADRTRRLKEVNIEPSDWVAKSICFSIVRLAITFGYKIKDQLSVAEFDHKQLSELTEQIFNSKKYKEYVKAIYVLDAKTIKKFDALKDVFEQNRKQLSEAVKGVRPYLDPKLSQVIIQNDVKANVLTEVPLITLKILYEDMPKSGHTINPDDSEFWDGFKVFWEKLVLDHEAVDDGQNFDQSLRSIINVLLDIHKRACENNLFYDA